MWTLYSRGLLACLFVVLVWAPAPASADMERLQPFFGHFVGHSLDTEGEGVSKRDFDVTIEATDNNGFQVSWRTFIYRNNGDVKKKDFSIEFRPTDRSGIYTSAEKTDMFGARIPSDPMKGDAYTWAVVGDQRLTVYGFAVTDDGGYEMQVYHRTLTDFGMNLEFSRQREDGVFRRISGTLRRVID